MGRHVTEDMAARTVQVFTHDQGMRGFRVNKQGVGADATAVYRGREVEFEFKAAKTWVQSRHEAKGRRPGRFRVNPGQHEAYGSRWLYYVLITYDGSEKDGFEITQLRIIRSDLLPQRTTVISLSAFSPGEEVSK